MNRESFETLVNAYHRRLYLYALHILRNHEDAEEAVQDAFLKVHRALEKSGDQPVYDARLNAWLFKITLNVVRNRLRRKQLTRVSVDALNDSDASHNALEDRSSPDVIVDRETTLALIERAIRALPAHLFEAARLRFIEGLTHTEIAEQCSTPLGTIKSNVFRAKLMLRHALRPALGV